MAGWGKGWGKGGGGGGGRSWNEPNDASRMEEQLTQMTNTLYAAILDLNNNSAKVNSLMSSLTRVRSSLLVHYGVETNPQAFSGGDANRVQAPKGKGKGGKGAAQQPPAKKQKTRTDSPCRPGEKMMQDFKSKLVQCVAQRSKKVPGKDLLVIDCSETEIEVDGQMRKGYIACLHSPDLDGSYTAEPTKGKKEAMQNACKLALEAEFPGQQPALVKVNDPDAEVKPDRPKTTLPGANANEIKGKACRAVALLLGRTTTATDLVYTTQHSNGKFVTTLTITEYGSEAYTGAPGKDKKQAEQNAASVMLETLADVIEAADAEHAIKKEKKREEELKRLEERLEAKRAAGEIV